MNSFREIVFFIKGLYNAKRSKYLSSRSLKKRQEKLYRKLVSKVFIKSDFYSKYQNISLDRIPLINKKQHMNEFSNINTVGLIRDKALELAIQSEQSREFSSKCNGFSVGLSSGTSGSRGLFVLSNDEQTEWAGYIWGKMMPLTFKKQRIAFFLRANNNLYTSINSLLISFNYFDLLIPIERHIEQLNRLKPSILIAPAQVLSLLADFSGKTLLIKPIKIISVAEVLESTVKSKISSAFECNVDEIYQCTEGFLAATCKSGNLHLNEDQLIIEKDWIDRQSRRFSPIITDLKRSTQPIVRYRLDDILVEAKSACRCGANTTTLEKIEGRCDDILMLMSMSNNGDPISVFPDFVRNRIIIAAPTLSDYRVVQTSKNTIDIYLQPLSIKMEVAIEKELQSLWRELGVSKISHSYKKFEQGLLANKRRRVIGLGSAHG